MLKTLPIKKLAIAAGAVVVVLLIGAAVMLLAGALPGFSLPQTPRARWGAKGFAHYRLVYRASGLVDCTVTAEVRAESVVTSQTDPPGGAFCAIMSVTGLFERIDTLVSGPRCGPNGCGCDGPLEVAATYDPALGYPLTIDQQLHPEQRWRYFDYWVHNSIGGGCTLIGYSGTLIEVQSLTPLQ